MIDWGEKVTHNELWVQQKEEKKRLSSSEQCEDVSGVSDRLKT